MLHRRVLPLLLAALVMLPSLFLRLGGVSLPAPAMVGVAGLAILGASFLLLWACDAAQADISQALALAMVALMAVLPEYAVDMYFTWQAGKHPQGDYAHFAIANMTGANRLLIGVAWGLIALVFWLRYRREVIIGVDRRMELLFLALATGYAFFIPLKGTLDWYDGVVLLGIYGWYILQAGKRPTAAEEAHGPAELLLALPRTWRWLATLGLFLVAGLAILLNAQPFCEGLVATGRLLKIHEFLLVQWLAPIASEAPEFIVALVFAWRGRAGLALGSLLSAKLNQWTLLVGMIPGIYALAHGSLGHPMPMDHFQMHEILLTASQSLLAVVILASLRLSVTSAVLLFTLFVGQLIVPELIAVRPGLFVGLQPSQVHPVFSFFYLVAALALYLHNPLHMKRLGQGLKVGADGCCGGEPSGDELGLYSTDHCPQCPWRKVAARAVEKAP